MRMAAGIIEMNVHGLRTEEAVNVICREVMRAGSGVYRIRIIHGYHGGTRIRESIREEFGYGREPAVKRIEMGHNPGITELVLREY